MSNWIAAEIILAITLLALAMPREEGLLIPERRNWLAPLRRLSRKVRRRIEADGAREADEYVAALHGDPESVTVRQSELPYAMATFPVKPLAEGETAPWAPALWAPDPASQPAPAPPRKAKRDAPTIVMEVIRPGIEHNLRPYLRDLPSYDD